MSTRERVFAMTVTMRKKVAIITSTFPRREHDTDPPFVYDLARRLTAAFDVTVLCPHAPGAKTAETMSGVAVRRFRYAPENFETLAYGGGILNRFRQSVFYYLLVPPFLLGELAAVTRCLRAEKSCLVNAHWLIPQGLVAVLAKAAAGSKAPLVCTLHGGDLFGLRGALFDRLKKFVLRRCAAVNVVSTAMADDVAGLGVERARINVIPMGVDLINSFVPGSFEKNPKSLLFVGRIAEKKGLIYLINAMPRVLARHPDARLTIVGHGPLETVIKGRIQELGLQQAITFRGAVLHGELPEIYQRAQIVVFPSIIDSRGDTEGFGLVMVEAMGCCCAVIASDLPAIHDSVRHGETGVLARQKDPEDLAGKIISLLDDPGECRLLGARARGYVVERYDWTITAEKYAAVFDSLT